jgi:threonine dehydrogenase-like Zn-dependent dehydrogenase
VRAVQFDLAHPTFPASLTDIPEPELPGPASARVAVTTAGICGSDLHLFTQNVGPTPTLFSMGTVPFVLGHEIDPCISCGPRGIDPPCANGARGWTSSCLNLDSRVVSLGRTLGFTQGLGGGWADQVLAHDSMLHPIPDGIADRGASLYEPLSIACHGVLRAPPHDGEPALIVGAGVIGLAALAGPKDCSPVVR